jgi:DNA-binding transcriptional MerR regulator
MPIPKPKRNAFSPTEVRRITGISLPMLDYLSRMDYLQPYYVEPGVRGKVRYYSYRDLVVARTIQRLRETGVELARLKEAIQQLARDETWFPENPPNGATVLRWLVTDGKRVMLENDDGFLDELRPNGQRAFAFIINLQNMQGEIKSRIPRGKRRLFSMENNPMEDARPNRRNRGRS